MRIPILIAATLSVLPPLLRAAEYDLIVRNGTLIDGTGGPRIKTNVAVSNGRIAAIGELAQDTAKQTIDAAGLIVAPGFIDVHTHVDDDIYKNPLAENFIRDGVTTIVSGNCGGSVTNIATFFDRVTKDGSAVNNATLYGHNTVLRAVKGASVEGDLDADQIKRAQALVDKAMTDGAIGFSTGLIYTPGTWAKTDEIIEVAKPAGARGGIYATHMRDEGNGIMKSIDEALRIGKEAGFGRIEISHFKLPTNAAIKLGRGTTLKAGSDATLARVDAARAAGQEVWLDQYPYTASSTTLNTLLPDGVLERGGDAAKAMLQDPANLPKLLADMKRKHETNNNRTDMSYAVVASASGRPELAGKSIKQIAQLAKFKAQQGSSTELMGDAPNADDLSKIAVTMNEQYRVVFDIYVGGGASCVFHSMDETEVVNILKSPIVGIASDSGIRVFGAGVPHPRGYGTNTRILGRYVRDLKAITLEDAVRKMTSLPAHSFRMADRGTVKVGAFADLTLFNPDTVADKATFDEPHQYAVGIEHVIVNGVEVFDGTNMTGKKSGMPIYGPAKK